MLNPWLIRLSYLLVAYNVCTAASFSQEAILLQHRWELEPPLGAEWIPTNPPPNVRLNLERLGSSVAEYRLEESRRVADASDLLSSDDKTAAQSKLLQLIRNGESNRHLLLAELSAWSKLFNPEHAQEIWTAVESKPVERAFFERILMEQKCDVAKEAWLQRLSNPECSHGDLMLAVEGVAACQVTEARPALEQLVRSDAIFPPTRIVASRALGTLATDGLEALAEQILASNRTAKEQLAASLLAKHKSPAAEQSIAKIIAGPFAPAQILAFDWYVNHRPEQAKELAGKQLEHPDSSMRLAAAKVLHGYDDTDSLRLQSQLLSDRNVTNRRTIRDHLIAKAASETLKPVVDEVLSQHLTGEAYEGVEQAILVVVALDEKERCSQLIALLDHPRPEVHIRAAWALQEIAVDPEILAEIHKHCLIWTDKIASGFSAYKPTDVTRVSFLFEAIGRNAYEPAEEMLRRYVPKQSQKMQPVTRTPAIWALGQIWKGRDDSGLEAALAARILDMSMVDPEDDCVKYTCALALGLMGTKSSIGALKSAPYDASHPIGYAIRWALEQIGPE